VHSVLKIPINLQSETLNSFYLLAFSIPVVIATSGLRGILEAYQRFGFINAVRIPMGIFTFMGPLLVLPFSQSLFPVVAVLTAGRLVAFLVHAQLCYYVIPALGKRIVFRKEVVNPLISFGSWLTVANIINPLMLTFDRFFIGALISVTFVSYYTTPYELVTKIWLIPSAMVGVLFPAFAATFIVDRQRTKYLFDKSIKAILLAVFPVTVLMVMFAHDIMMIWLGAEFATNCTLVLQCLSIGVFIYSLAHFPAEILNSAGLAHLTAKIRLVELPLYAALLYFVIIKYGILGCAMVWVFRIVVDTAFMFYISFRELSYDLQDVMQVVTIFIVLISILAVPIFMSSLAYKLMYLSLLVISSCYIVTKTTFLKEEKDFFLKYVGVGKS
jgi:O-antigen/teichoic acid export membrane protein